jgi:hypothetical protein
MCKINLKKVMIANKKNKKLKLKFPDDEVDFEHLMQVVTSLRMVFMILFTLTCNRLGPKMHITNSHIKISRVETRRYIPEKYPILSCMSEKLKIVSTINKNKAKYQNRLKKNPKVV